MKGTSDRSTRALQAASGLVWAIVFAVFVQVLAYAFAWALAAPLPQAPFARGVAALLAAALTAGLMLPRPDGLPRLGGIGMAMGRTSRRAAVLGLSLGAGGGAAAVGVGLLAGWLRLETAGDSSPGAFAGLDSAWAVLAALTIGALGEELFLRGYGFQQLARALTPPGAALATGVFFGALHAGNPGSSLLSTINTCLFGILFGYSVVRFRSLWPAIGMHLGWNVSLAAWGAPVSGLRMKITSWSVTPAAAEALSGGAYGPEASVGATLVVLLAALAIWKTPIPADDFPLIWDDVRPPKGGPGEPMRQALNLLLIAALAGASAQAKLSESERQTLIRDLTAELGTAKLLIPRSKKPLDVTPDGRYDAETWGEAMGEFGPAARAGDLVEITKVEVKGKRLVLELNHGLSGGRKWWHKIQISGSTNSGRTLGDGVSTNAPGGTEIALLFEEAVPSKTSDEIKKLLKPVLDFEQRSATELYLDKIEPEFREAIEEKEVIVGMDRDMVLLARNRPDRKYRDFNSGIETEDWIYGEPPGDVVFVTFEDGKVIRVKHEHANLGGETKQIPQVTR